jgi:hypothetical protein
LHPIVTNPYTLLGLVLAEAKFFTCVDLKDAFFYIRLVPQSQIIFAFQWENPNTGEKGQLTWTLLPYGFKNSPTIFGTALASDLKAFSANWHSCTLLQYIDNLLLAGPTQEDYMEGTCLLLSLLWEAGYKVSRKKAQICQNTVKYLSFHLSQGQCKLGLERKQTVYSIPDPKTRKQIRKFLGATGFCQIWIPKYSHLVKPLYETTKGGEREPLVWGRKQEKAFKELKWHSQMPLLWAYQM